MIRKSKLLFQSSFNVKSKSYIKIHPLSENIDSHSKNGLYKDEKLQIKS